MSTALGGEHARRDQEGRQRVGQHVVTEHLAPRGTRQARRLDVPAVAQHQAGAATEAGHRRHHHEGDGEHLHPLLATDHDDQEQRQHDRRERQQHVDDAHHHRVDLAADVPGEQPDRGAEGEGDERRGEADEHVVARRVDAAAEQVAAHLVGAEPVRARRTLQRDGLDAQRVVRGEEPGHDAEQQERGEQQDTGDERPRLAPHERDHAHGCARRSQSRAALTSPA